jgi:hypothetical protein
MRAFYTRNPHDFAGIDGPPVAAVLVPLPQEP